jgi:CheY-like chemotaxis protein
LSAADRAAKLTRQLLAFSRRQVLEARVVSLNQIVDEVVPMLRRLIGEQIEVVVELAPGLHPVKADPAQLEQVIMNLAVNARDAMKGGGVLTLSTANATLDDRQTSTATAQIRPGPYACLTVTDTGDGMDAETQKHIFEPFFTTKGQEAGTGLGLATVYGIVRQSDGHIELETELKKGTTFRVFLPRTGELATQERPSDIRAVTNRGTETILLVEDELLVRQALSRMLRRLGYNMLVARSGEEALEVAASATVDLVITDVIMPTLSGTDLALRLRQDNPDLRVIFISGYTDGALGEGIALGARTEFLQKPIPHDVLATKVRTLLERPAALSELTRPSLPG